MPVAQTAAVDELVGALKRAWREGADPDAAAAVRDHPELLAHRSLLVDLAYEEYCLREEAGSTPDPDDFCRRFPAYRSHLREVIRGHRLLADNPALFASSPAWPAPGDRVEGVTVVAELGRGAFARVYLGRDPETGDRPVVLKLSPARSGEARTLGGLQHKHVVGVLWARQAGSLYAVCMPYVGAVTLADALGSAFASAAPPRGGLPLLGRPGPELPQPAAPAPVLTGRERYADAAAAVVSRVAAAVAHLHGAGLVHGDLKPSNVLLAPGGHPYLIDFNLSAPDSASLLTCGGTLPYMAPERLRLLLGQAGTDSPAAADVYALGVVLFETLTGRVPFEPPASAGTVAAAADLLRRSEADPRPAARHPAVPAALARLIDRCLDPDPRRRPSAAELGRALDRHLTRRARRVWALAGLAAVAATAAVGPALGGRLSQASPAPADSSPAAVAGSIAPTTADEFFARGLRFLRAGNPGAALGEFQDFEVHGGQPKGKGRAYVAYCATLRGSHQYAAEVYRMAVAEGFSPPWVRNNLAFSLTMQADDRGRLNLAVVEAGKALELDPGFRPARLNRAYARLLLVRGRHELAAAGTDPLEDLAAAMEGGPFPPEVYLAAAQIAVTFAQGREEALARAVGYARKAVEAGYPPEKLGRDRTFGPVAARPDFRRVLELPASPTPAPSPNPRLATPPLD